MTAAIETRKRKEEMAATLSSLLTGDIHHLLLEADVMLPCSHGRSRRADLAGVAEGWQGNGVSVSRGLLGMPCQSRQSSYSTIWESHLRVLAAFARPGVRAACPQTSAGLWV